MLEQDTCCIKRCRQPADYDYEIQSITAGGGNLVATLPMCRKHADVYEQKLAETPQQTPKWIASAVAVRPPAPST